MRRVLLALTAGLVSCSVTIALQAQGKGRNASKARSDAAVAASGSHVAVAGGIRTASGDLQVSFSTGDVRLIRDHYAARYRGLPPGLQKKLARGGSLPPGWQKKLEPFPVELDRRLARLPDGYSRGVIDGHAVIYVPGTSVVIDAAVLF